MWLSSEHDIVEQLRLAQETLAEERPGAGIADTLDDLIAHLADECHQFRDTPFVAYIARGTSILRRRSGLSGYEDSS
jgi:hypothetical protein